MSEAEMKMIIKKYAKSLEELGINFKHIYLFGSHAKKKAGPQSDIDIAIVSKVTPEGKKYFQKKIKIWEATLKVDPRIEPVWISEKDFKNKSSTIGKEVNETGILYF